MYGKQQIHPIQELYQTNNLVIIKNRLNAISKHPEQYTKNDLISAIRFLEDLVGEIWSVYMPLVIVERYTVQIKM